MGQSIAIMAQTNHVQEGTDPNPNISNPPTSGKHYASEYNAGFYDTSNPEATSTHPEGYLVHNLEHGYVIFGYNCDLVTDCANLQNQIRGVLDAENNFKVISFPFNSINCPVVLTFWGQM